ncbi:MAG: FG-GAP-like repeat-containing protein [Terracidiphilus sp.]|jgi:subtilase family serine protease
MATAPPLQVLPNHVATIVNGQSAQFLGALPDSQKMRLSIVLPLRNQDQLQQLLVRLYDPASSDYHKFLSVEEFTDQFGPSEDDYQEVVDFATANGFTVSGQAKNRLVVSVAGTAAQVNAAFHVQMGEYQHPTENRSFISPDREPSVALRAQIAHIDGMNSLSLPRAMNVLPNTSVPMATVNGSGPGGSYLGSDMRAAYYGGSALTGVNQTVALVEFGGYLKSDVDLTFSNTAQTYSVPLDNILVGSATSTVYEQDAEQVLDIVQAIGMAPGLSAVEIYIGDPTSTSSSAAVLNQIATDNTAKQIGCSWGWIPGNIPAQEAILQEMVAQGQTFFAASGDDGAFQASISPYFYPAESQYVTAVGGTHLTTAAAAGAWSSEVAWNSSGHGSGGGISPDNIPIPSWQSGLATSSNGGSNTLRNVPDVAAEGDFDNYACNLGSCAGDWAGTSFATPRWAGFMALVNQQAVEAGNAPLGGIGFINAVLTQIGTGSNYSADLHDIQSGNNDTENQTVWFSAVPSYDLVTGWGSPAGQSLIDDLAGPAVPGFWISSSSGTVNVVQGASTTATISVTDAGGFSGNVNLAVTSTLPSGVTASFSLASTTSSSVLTLTTSTAAAQGSYAVTITGTSGTITESTTIDLVIHGPSFNLSSSTSSLIVNQGASATSTITVNDLYGFTGNVNLQVSGLPSGLTASFGANPTSTTSLLTLTASSTAAPWIGYITVTGTCGSLTASTQIYVNLVAPGFTLSTISSLSIGQGSTSSTFVDISTFNGFKGNVTLSVSGLPSGVTAFFTPNPISSSGQLTITTSSLAAVGSATLTITGTSGAITATATLTLTVNAPGFTLYGGGSVSLGQGSTATSYVYVNDQYGFSGSVTLSASGLPAGVTASFATNPTTYSSQITFAASCTATPGTYPVTITGTAGAVTATTNYTLIVGAPTFTISAPSSETISQSGSISAYAYVNDQYGFNGSVALSVSGLPTGVTVSFGTNSTTYYSQMTLTASSLAATGNYPITITGTFGSIVKSTTMTLSIVAPSIQVSASSPVTLGIGTSFSTYVYVYANNGYNSNVTLSMSGLPTGITASFSPNPVSLTNYSNSSQITLTASGTVAAGSYTGTLTATSGSVTASTSITITVAAPSFTLSSYTSPTIVQGGSGSTYVYLNGVNGFNSPVTLSVSGLPSGVTAAFQTNPTTYSSYVTFSTINSIPTGTYPVTVTGTSGTIVATTSISLTVVTPSFTLSPNQSTYTVSQGASVQSYLYVNSTNGLPGPATLSATGLPSGVTLSFGTNPTYYFSSMTFTASSTATPGTSTVTITGTSGSTTASITVTLAVNAPSFTLTPAPGSITLVPGGSDKTSVALSALNGFSGSVNFSIAGLPSGVTSSWNPASSATGSVLTLTAASSAQPGKATATITGTSGSLSATAQLPVTINSPGSSTTTALAITAAGSSVTTTTWGALVTLTASVTSGGSPVTSGLVNFCDSAASYCGDIHLLGSAQLTGSGTASLNLLPLPGSHSYKAVFAGTAANGTSSSPAGSLQVAGAYPTTTSLASSGTVGTYTLNATVTGAGPQALSGSVSFVDTSSGNSTIASTNLIAQTPALTWAQPSTTSAGPYPGALVTGDFNGDGISDVAILDPQYNAIIVRLGNADGTFTNSNLSPQTSSYPVAITAADFNGDGIPDLAVVTSSGIVNIFLGNGDGTFNAVSTSTNSGASSSAIVAEDFNGDGIPDLAINDNANNRLVILLGNGNGTFTASTSYPATSSPPEAMAVADFNGDGNLDIAVGNYNGAMTVLLGNGDGTFSGVPNTLSAGTDPASIAVADFNGDGKPDLAVASRFSSTLSVLLGNGDGTFTAATSPSVIYYSSAVVPIDVNQDGVVDLVVTSSSNASASILLGNGNGTFTQAPSVTLLGAVNGAAAARVTSSGYPAVIATFPSLSEAVVLEPYIAQSATASTTVVGLGATGSNLVDASYGGDATYSGSNSSMVTLKGPNNTSIITWAAPASIMYGTPLSASQLNATANVPGTFVYSPAAGTVLGLGNQSLGVTFTPTDTTDYTTATASATLLVKQATPVITWPTPAAIVYGTPLSATQLNATANVPGTFVYSPAAGTVLGLGNQSLGVTFTPTDTTDYTTATASVTLLVKQATPVITWPTPAAIIYGTPLSATQLNATTNVPGTFVYLPPAGTEPSAGPQTLSVTFAPTDTTDYTTATQTVQLTVSKAALTVTANSASMLYDGVMPTLDGSLAGVVPGDGITASYATTATTTSAAGTYPITTTLNDPNSRLGNYAVINTPGTLTIGLVTPAITWVTPPAIPYGTALGTAQLNAGTTVAGSFSYTPATGTVLNPGSQPLKAIFTPTDTVNYKTATANVTLTVNQATPDLSLASSADSTFFSNSVTFTATLSPANGASSSAAPPSGSVAFYDGTTQLGTATIATGAAAYTTSNLAAGTHSITAVYSGDSNYVTLTGFALNEVVENFTVAPSTGGSTSATVSQGGQAVYSLVFSPPSGDTFPAAINLAVTGLPVGATATFSPTSIPAGAGPTTVTLTVALPATAAMQRQRSPLGPSQSPIVLGLIFIPLAVVRRRRLQHLGKAAWVLLFLLGGAVGIAGVSGCGGSSGPSQTTSQSGTAPQTYTLTVAATSGSLSNTTTLTLTVE